MLLSSCAVLPKDPNITQRPRFPQATALCEHAYGALNKREVGRGGGVEREHRRKEGDEKGGRQRCFTPARTEKPPRVRGQ